MHIITASVTVSIIKIQLLMILKKGLLTELEKNLKRRFSEGSSLDKQLICVNTQLKSSKLNVCVRKSNSVNRFAIACDCIAYHLVHFVSVWVINKCKSGIDFLPASAQYNSNFMNRISASSQVF